MKKTKMIIIVILIISVISAIIIVSNKTKEREELVNQLSKMIAVDNKANLLFYGNVLEFDFILDPYIIEIADKKDVYNYIKEISIYKKECLDRMRIINNYMDNFFHSSFIEFKYTIKDEKLLRLINSYIIEVDEICNQREEVINIMSINIDLVEKYINETSTFEEFTNLTQNDPSVLKAFNAYNSGSLLDINNYSDNTKKYYESVKQEIKYYLENEMKYNEIDNLIKENESIVLIEMLENVNKQKYKYDFDKDLYLN